MLLVKIFQSSVHILVRCEKQTRGPKGACQISDLVSGWYHHLNQRTWSEKSMFGRGSRQRRQRRMILVGKRLKGTDTHHL